MEHNKDDVRAILVGMLGDKPRAYSAYLARKFKSIETAIFFQQIYFWSDKGVRSDGFIYKSKREIEAETALSRYDQDKARKQLEKLNILETKLVKANGAPTMHYRVNIDNLIAFLQKCINEDFANGLENGSLIQKRTLRQSITESTTENTTESNRKEKKIKKEKKSEEAKQEEISFLYPPLILEDGKEVKVKALESIDPLSDELSLSKEKAQKALKPNKDTSDKEHDSAAAEIVDYFNDTFSKLFGREGQFRLTPSLRKLINGRFRDGYKKEDFIRVIDNMAITWGHDPKMSAYFRMSILFRPSHFDDYLNIEPALDVDELWRPIHAVLRDDPYAFTFKDKKLLAFVREVGWENLRRADSYEIAGYKRLLGKIYKRLKPSNKPINGSRVEPNSIKEY